MGGIGLCSVLTTPPLFTGHHLPPLRPTGPIPLVPRLPCSSLAHSYTQSPPLRISPAYCYLPVSDYPMSPPQSLHFLASSPPIPGLLPMFKWLQGLPRGWGYGSATLCPTPLPTFGFVSSMRPSSSSVSPLGWEARGGSCMKPEWEGKGSYQQDAEIVAQVFVSEQKLRASLNLIK